MKLFSIFILVFTSALFGCTVSTSPTSPQPVKDNVKPLPPIEVMRYGQYTLVSISPTEAQQDPTQQIISYSIPVQLNVSVAAAMQYVLKDTGYNLCPPDNQTDILFQQSLPAIHRSMGPIRLNQALTVLVGAVWELKIDEVGRTVCPTLKADRVDVENASAT